MHIGISLSIYPMTLYPLGFRTFPYTFPYTFSITLA